MARLVLMPSRMVTHVRFLTPSAPAKSNVKNDLIAALATGQAAGLVMAVAIFTVGGRAPNSFFAALAVHQVLALAWSLVFGFLITRVMQTLGNVLAVGLAIGVLSQVLDSPVIAPALLKLSGTSTWAQSLPLGWSWAVHLIFGLAFILFVPIRNRLSAR